MSARNEAWTRDGRTAMVDVQADETVIVAYDLFADMLTQLGFHKVDDEADQP